MNDMKITIPMPLANRILTRLAEKMIFGKTGIKTDMHLKELCVNTNDGKITAHINADISVDTKDFETVIKRLK